MTKIFLLLLLSNLLILFNLKKFSRFINIYDKPNKKLKKHKSNVPLVGGIIIIINIIIYSFLSLFFETPFKDIVILNKEYISVFFLATSFFLLGLYDDKFKLNPGKKFFLSIVFCIFALTLNKNLLIENVNLSFLDRTIIFNEFSFFFTLFCVIILVNSLNFYDGINGQSLIFFIIVFGYLSIQSPLQLFYLILIFVCIFVLFLNMQNKIFLGDSGVYLLGSILAILLIYEYNIFKTIRFADEIFLLLILPGLDLLRLTVMRILKGKNAFYGDRNHIHHLLIKRNSLIKTNLILAVLTSLPIILFKVLVLNFFLVFIFFVIIYGFVILKMKKNAS